MTVLELTSFGGEMPRRPARRHKPWVTLWTVLWCSIMAVWVVWRVFGDSPPDVPMGTATAFTGFITGCLAGDWGFYRWARDGRDSEAAP